MQRIAANKTGHDRSRGSGRLFLQPLAILIRMIGIANQHQRQRTVRGFVGGKQIVQPFFFDKTGDGDNVLPGFQRILIQRGLSRLFGGKRRLAHAVIDHVSVGTAVFGFNQRINHFRDNNNFIGIFHRPFLTKTQHLFRHFAPLLAIVVRAVVGKNDALAEQAQQRDHQARADRMNVNHI